MSIKYCFLLILVGLLCVNAATQISTCSDLDNIPDNSLDTFELTGNVNCFSYTGYTPAEEFKGTLDGKGYYIEGLTVSGSNEAAVIGSTGTSGSTGEAAATIQNLEVRDSTFSASGSSGRVVAGAILGRAYGTTTLLNLKSTNNQISAVGMTNGDRVLAGGIVGDLDVQDIQEDGSSVADSLTEGCTISASSTTGSTGISEQAYAGGIAGLSDYLIDGCGVVDSTVNGNSPRTRVGGIVGYAGYTVQQSYFINTNPGAAITSTHAAGGIAGRIAGRPAVGSATLQVSRIEDCFVETTLIQSTGSTTVPGGIVGEKGSGSSQTIQETIFAGRTDANGSPGGPIIGQINANPPTASNNYYDNTIFSDAANSLANAVGRSTFNLQREDNSQISGIISPPWTFFRGCYPTLTGQTCLEVYPNHTESSSTVNLAYKRQPFFIVKGVKCEDRCDARSDVDLLDGQWSVQFFKYEAGVCGVPFNTQWKPWEQQQPNDLSPINFAASCHNTEEGARIGISSADVPFAAFRKRSLFSLSNNFVECDGQTALESEETVAVYINAWQYQDCSINSNGFAEFGTKGGIYHGCLTETIPLKYGLSCGATVDSSDPAVDPNRKISDYLPFKCYKYSTNLTCNRDFCGRPQIDNCTTVADFEGDFRRGGFIFETTLNTNVNLPEECVSLPDACQKDGNPYPVCCEGINYHDCYRKNAFDDQDTFYPTNN